MALTVTYVVLTAVQVACAAVFVSRRRSTAIQQRLRALVEYTNTILKTKAEERPLAGDELDALERSLRAVAADVRAVVDNIEIEASRRQAILSSMTEGVLAVDKDLRVIFS